MERPPRRDELIDAFSLELITDGLDLNTNLCERSQVVPSLLESRRVLFDSFDSMTRWK
jgi:hypothetical protein